MALRLAGAGALDVSSSATTRPRWTCAIVNNMPDGAFDATERQYLGLLEAGAGDDVLEVRRYTVDGVPRGERTAARIASEYLPLDALYAQVPDLLIVTGSNPIEQSIYDEPYWDDLEELLLWGRDHVRSTLLSCLSAHAALTIFDDVDRERLASKCTGVFSQAVESGHPLVAGIDREIVLPHSRQNTSPRQAVEDAGYRVLVHSTAVGWGIAVRETDGRELVLVQGHPEYDPTSLLREYRRDAERYVNHERDDLPVLPLHCVAPDDWESLEDLHRALITDRRDSNLFESYPFDDVGARAPWPWRSMATQFYANWLASVN
jgi:homoserine O-succinyltransferase